MKNYSCDQCHFFKTNTLLSPDSGECHRKSPTGMDSNGMSVGLQKRQYCQAGVISDAIFSETPVLLYRNQFELLDEADPLPIAKNGNVPLSTNEIFPFIIDTFASIFIVRVYSSLLNVGAASVGASPVLKINLVAITNAGSSVVGTIEVPVPSASAGVFGNAVDKPASFAIQFTDDQLFQLSNGHFGFYIDLDTTSSPDYIAEIRNANVLIQTLRVFDASDPFPIIEDRNTFWCGQFKTRGVRTERCWDCDYFNALDVGVDNSGQCRRNAPSKFDQQTISSSAQPSSTNINYQYLFPNIEDGTDNFCSGFKPSTTTVPDPV